MTIVQKPDPLNLSGNLSDFVFFTDEAIAFSLFWQGRELYSGVYTPGNDHKISVSVKEVIESVLEFQFRDILEVYSQDLLVDNFQAFVDGRQIADFKVIKGGVATFGMTAKTFLQQHFLTWQPREKKISYSSPEYLTYYAVEDSKVKIKAYFNDASGSLANKEIVMASLSAGKAYTIPVMYAVVVGKMGSYPAFYDVWIESTDGSVRYSYVQRYVYDIARSEQEEYVIFENSLGGIDAFRAYGNTEYQADNTHNIAVLGDELSAYRIDMENKYTKNTGYLDEYELKWIRDFFPALKKYIFRNNILREIVLTEDNVTASQQEQMGSYEFTYRYSDDSIYLNLPILSSNQYALSKPINVAFDSIKESIKLEPRLAEFPMHSLSEGTLIPVQEPFSESWKITNAGAIVNYTIQKINEMTNGDLLYNRFKGYYITESALKKAYPNPITGESAWVGEPFPGVVYVVGEDGWETTGEAPKYNDSVDLNDYVLNSVFSQVVNDLEEKIKGLDIYDVSEAVKLAEAAAAEALKYAELAGQSGELAKYAKEQGDYAKEQGDLALQAKEQVVNDVLFKTPQNLSEEEQAQVKRNIGLQNAIAGLITLPIAEFSAKVNATTATKTVDNIIPKGISFLIVDIGVVEGDSSIPASPELSAVLCPVSGGGRIVFQGTASTKFENFKISVISGSAEKDGMGVEVSTPRSITYKVFQVRYLTEQGSGTFKGSFNSLQILQSAYPTAKPGDYAYVGNPRHLYEWDSSAWQDRGLYITDVDQALDIDSGKAIANKAVAVKLSELAGTQETQGEEIEKINAEAVFSDANTEELPQPEQTSSDYATSALQDWEGHNIHEHYATREQLADIKPVVINGNVTNNADNEDLEAFVDPETSNGVMRLKDRMYSPGTFSGKGYKILRQNIVSKNRSSSNILTQDMINEPNTVYEIRYDFNINGAKIIIPQGCTLRFNGGSLFDSTNNGILEGNFTTIETNRTDIFKKGFSIEGTWSNRDIYVNWFDVIGDGTSDDSLEFQRISKMISLNGKGNLIFEPQKTYAVKPTEDFDSKPKEVRSILDFVECSVTVDLAGSTFKMIPNSFPFYQVISFLKCPYYHISNGIIIGDRIEHDYSPYTTNTGLNRDTHEFGFGIYSRGSVGIIENMNISQCIGDGIIIGDYTKLFTDISTKVYSHVWVRNCESAYNRRQGITIGESMYALIENVKIHHIGTWDGINGTSPMAGIDIENESSVERRSRYVEIKDTSISDCTVWCIIYGDKTEHETFLDELNINNCNLKGSTYLYAKDLEKRTINNCILAFEEYRETNAGLVWTNFTINNCSFKINKSNMIMKNCNSFNSNFLGSEEFNSSIIPINCTFYNVNFKNILGAPNPGWPGVLSGKRLLGFDFYQGSEQRGNVKFVSCTVRNCSSIAKDGLVDNVLFDNCEISNSYLLSKDYFKFRNCRISNPGGYSAGYGLYLLNCSNCSLSDERIDDLPFGGYDWKTFKNCDIVINNIDAEIYKECLYADFYNCSIEINLTEIAAMPKLNFYNCHVRSNAEELQFTGIKQNTTFELIVS